MQAEIVELDGEIAASSSNALPSADTIDADLLGKYLDSFRDVTRDVFTNADPAELADFYRAIGLSVLYDHESQSAQVLTGALDVDVGVVGREHVVVT